MHGQRAKQNFFFQLLVLVARRFDRAEEFRAQTTKFLREMEAEPLRLELRWTHAARVHPIWCQVIEAAFHVTECDLFSEPLATSRTCDPSCFFSWRQRQRRVSCPAEAACPPAKSIRTTVCLFGPTFSFAKLLPGQCSNPFRNRSCVAQDWLRSE